MPKQILLCPEGAYLVPLAFGRRYTRLRRRLSRLRRFATTKGGPLHAAVLRNQRKGLPYDIENTVAGATPCLAGWKGDVAVAVFSAVNGWRSSWGHVSSHGPVATATPAVFLRASKLRYKSSRRSSPCCI